MNTAVPALFLDRDDTLVRDAGYMSRPEQIELLPGVAEALRDARAAGFRLYLVTNQSGIGRGYYSLDDALACNRRLEELVFGSLRSQVARHKSDAGPETCDLRPETARQRGFDGVCIAPERPDEPSRYRKPSPAYLQERIAEDGLDPAASWMVGDKVSDLECGLAAGVRTALVARGSTGAPREDAAAFAAARGIPVFDSFPAFVRDLLSRIPDGPEKKN
ncbi:MAG: HAD-IIIA family hydrolase [Kiritimatiellae bacterium]|nr:HAD-IIIA family hydrolase [Kiritimatiellia bacterium]